MSRTDVHRPSAIIPEDYDFICAEARPSEGDPLMVAEINRDARLVLNAHRERTGGAHSTHEHGGNCAVCGAANVYRAWFWHQPTNTYIATGLDCAEKLDAGHAEEFRSLRIKLKAGHDAAAGKDKARRTLEEQGLGAVWAAYLGTTGTKPLPEIIHDMVSKLVRYGSLSEKQFALIHKALADQAAREQRIAVDRATSQHVGTVGKRETFINLTCRFVAHYDTAFGTTYVAGFEDAAGNALVYKGQHIVDRGDVVSLKATIKEHGERDGVKQTILSRPFVLEKEEQA